MSLVWNGSANSLWSNPSNWTPNEKPGAGISLRFPRSARTTSYNDLTNLALKAITFEPNGTGYALTGNAFSVTKIADLAVLTNTISNNMTLHPRLGTTITTATGAVLVLNGELTSQGGTLTIDGKSATSGTVVIKGTNGEKHSTLVKGILEIAGPTGKNNSDTTVSGTGEYTLDAAATMNSDLVVESGGVATLNGMQNSANAISNHSFSGSGSTIGGVGILNNFGTLQPGLRTGTANGTGTFSATSATLQPSSTLIVTLAGTVPGLEHDQLVSETGAIKVDGTLTVLPTGNFAVGDRFSIITARSVTGTFAGLPQNALIPGAGPSQDFQIGYSPTSVHLTIVPAAPEPSPPTYTKSIVPTVVGLGVSATVTFVITNPNENVVLSGIAFTDALPTNVLVDPTSFTSTCNVPATASGDNRTIFFAGGTLDALESCTVTANISSSTCGTYTNVSGAISATGTEVGLTATAVFTVLCAPTISKAFGNTTLALGDETTLTFTVTNPNPDNTLDNVSFIDDFSSTGLQVSNPSGIVTTCPAGFTFAADSGTSGVALNGLTLPAQASCTFTINVTAPAGTATPGLKTNMTDQITATDPGGNIFGTETASATIVLTGSVIVVVPNLSVTVSGPGWIRNRQQRVTFFITITNLGPGAATNVVLTDTLFARARIVRFTQLSGANFILADPATPSVSASIGTLPEGATAVFELVACVSLKRCVNSFFNTATITSTPTDGTASNNTSTATINVLPCDPKSPKHKRHVPEKGTAH